MLSPGIVQVLEGSSVALNWNYSLSLGFLIAMVKFNGDGIAMISAGGLVGALNAHFQERFNVSSTLGRASLFIYNVTVRLMENLAVSYLIPMLISGNEQFKWKS